MENKHNSLRYSSSHIDTKRFLKSNGKENRHGKRTLLHNINNFKTIGINPSLHHQDAKQTLSKIKFKNLQSLWANKKQIASVKQPQSSCACACHQQIPQIKGKNPSYADLANMRNKINDLQNKMSFYSFGVHKEFEDNIQKIKESNFKNNINTLQSPTISQLFKDHINQGKKIFDEQTEKRNQKSNNYSDSQNFLCNQSQQQLKLYKLQKYGNKHYLKQASSTWVEGQQKFVSYKDAISEKQDFKKFISWFEKRKTQLQNKIPQDESHIQLLIRNYEQKGSLIASAFNEVLRQLEKFSKPRAQFLKTLWNGHNEKTLKVFDVFYKRHHQSQKQNLLNCKDMHEKYQNEILKLRKTNDDLAQKYKHQRVVNSAIINTIRQMRKRLKRTELSIKQLIEANSELKNQNLYLLNENTKFLYQKITLINQAQTLKTLRTLRDIDFNNPTELNFIFNQNSNEKHICKQIKVLIYRFLLIQKERNKLSLKKYADETANLLLKEIKRQSISEDTKYLQSQMIYSYQKVNLKNQQMYQLDRPKLTKQRQSILNFIDCKFDLKDQVIDSQNKRQILFQYIEERIRQNPKQKLFIAHDYFSDDEQCLVEQRIVKGLLDRKFLTNAIVQNIVDASNYYGVNLKSYKDAFQQQSMKNNL